MSRSETERSKFEMVDDSLTVNDPHGEHQVTELKIPVPWGHIAVKAWNNPSGIPVLAIHGAMDNSGTFNRLLPLLPKSHYYVCVDLPGHGLSSHFPPGLLLDFFDFVMSVQLVLDHFAWDKVTLMGHSFGGQVCAIFAALYPRRIQKLVMLDALTRYALSVDEFMQHYKYCVNMLLEVAYGDKQPPSHTYEEALHRMVSKRVDSITEEAAKHLLERGLIKNGKGYTFSVDPRMRMLVPFSFHSKETGFELLGQISSPLLIVITNYVRNRIAARKEFQDAFEMFSQKSNFACVEVEGSHDVHSISPEKVSGDISKFLVRQTSML